MAHLAFRLVVSSLIVAYIPATTHSTRMDVPNEKWLYDSKVIVLKKLPRDILLKKYKFVVPS